MCAGYLAADGSDFADVIFGFSRGDLVGLCCGANANSNRRETAIDERAISRGLALRAGNVSST